MAASTTSTNSANLHVYFVKRWLKTLQPRLVLYPLAQKTKVPKGLGKQAKWLIYTKISSSTSALTEGTNPSEISFTTSNITATVSQYGQFVKVSDLLQFTGIDPVLENVGDKLARAGAETIEDLIVAELDAALTVQRVNARTTDDGLTAQDVVNMKEFIRASVTLKAAYVGPHESGKYAAVLHPSAEFDMLTELNGLGWYDARSMLRSQAEIMNGEIGQLYGLRFLVSDKMTAAANLNSVSVKKNYVIGEECFGAVELSDESVEIIMKNPGANDTSNPLNMFSTVGYKIKGFAAKNFDAARGILLKGASAL